MRHNNLSSMLGWQLFRLLEQTEREFWEDGTPSYSDGVRLDRRRQSILCELEERGLLPSEGESK